MLAGVVALALLVVPALVLVLVLLAVPVSLALAGAGVAPGQGLVSSSRRAAQAVALALLALAVPTCWWCPCWLSACGSILVWCLVSFCRGFAARKDSRTPPPRAASAWLPLATASGRWRVSAGPQGQALTRQGQRWRAGCGSTW